VCRVGPAPPFPRVYGNTKTPPPNAILVAFSLTWLLSHVPHKHPPKAFISQASTSPLIPAASNLRRQLQAERHRATKHTSLTTSHLHLSPGHSATCSPQVITPSQNPLWRSVTNEHSAGGSLSGERLTPPIPKRAHG
jgi:hypothetical protein